MKVARRSGRLPLLAAVSWLAMVCAHAPPVTGNRDPDAPIDPDHPEVNCKINTTVDCGPVHW